MLRASGKHAITVVLTEQEFQTLELIMQKTFRFTWSDCIRAMIAETGQKFLPTPSVTTDNTNHNTGRGKRGVTGERE